MFSGHEVQLIAASRVFIGGHSVIDALAEGAGAARGLYERVALSLDGHRVNVAVLHRNHRLWLDFSVCFDDRDSPLVDSPLIELRAETRADAGHKREGLVREVQLGNAAFDRRVFVDNRCTDDEARRVLGDEDVRAAVMLVLNAGVGRVTISRWQVAVRLQVAELPDGFDAEQLVLNLVTIACAGPPAETEKAQRGEGLLLGLGAAAVVLTGVFLSVLVACHGTPLSYFGLGFGAAALTVALSWQPMRRFVSGDSGSGGRRRWAVGLLAVSVGVTVAGVLTFVNVAFDDSPPRKVFGYVSSIRAETRRRDGSRGLSGATFVRWADGEESPRQFDEPVTEGTRCSEERHEGALGEEWRENLRVERR